MKKVKTSKFMLIVIGFIILYTVYNPGKFMVPIEKIDIPSGLGADIEYDISGKPSYSIPISVYTFAGEDKVLRRIHIGKDDTICGTRTDRQMQQSGKFLLGLEKVVILSEEFSRNGIGTTIDILFANPLINDTSDMAVCKGKAADLLALQMPGYPSSADYIATQLQNIGYFKFFEMDYKLLDIYIRLDAEDRRVKLPYIELVGGKPKITGMAVFKKDKMVEKLDLNETEMMNFLGENKVTGQLTLVNDYYNNICIYGKTKRKANCKKVGDKYEFNIDIAFKGKIVSNSLYKDLEKDSQVAEKFEKALAKEMKARSYEFIDKMKNEYGMDLIGLRRIATAKFGRHTGIDWDEVICSSDIKVNVKVEIDGTGRGSYQ